jgi:hypothetical protein
MAASTTQGKQVLDLSVRQAKYVLGVSGTPTAAKECCFTYKEPTSLMHSYCTVLQFGHNAWPGLP